MGFVVGGIIGQRWDEWRGAGGPFGAAIGPEEDVPGHTGRRQAFERGEIAWSPGEDMVVSVFRLWNDALFEWSHPGHGHDFFRYDIAFRAAGQDAWVSQGLDVAELRVEGPQQMWVRLQGFGDYAFTIRSCDGDDCGAFTVPVVGHLGPYTETSDPGNHPEVGGLIAERWHELGAWDGPLGLPVTREGSHNGIVSQLFEHGSITTAPQFGARMVVAACQRHNSVEVTWGGADTAYNAFRVDAYLGDRFVEQQFVFQASRTDWALPFVGSGSVIFNDLVNVGGEGGYFFFVFPVVADFLANPATPGLFPDSAPTAEAPPAGATPPVRVNYKSADSDVQLGFPALDGTPAHAFASHKTRADAIARHYANMRPLGFRMPQPDADDPHMTENVTLQLIAHLHAISKDPGFRAPRDLPSRFLVPIRLRQRKVGTVGTKNDYDMALKGLMVIAYRYRALLSPADLFYILNDLVPGDLTGGHDFDVETYKTLPGIPPFVVGPIIIPETENHLLMIESSRYLVNQLLHDRTGEETYDNTTNGLKDWLLWFLRLIACFDFMEFNARPYQRLALHAILNLHEFARDVELRDAAAIVLDYTAMKFAVSSTRGRRVSPFRRLQERISHPDTEFNDLMAPRGDQVAGFFSMYLGPVDRDFRPMTIYFNGWTDNAVIVGLAAYRPPPAAYIVALSRHAPAQHVFSHGPRPRWHGSDDEPDPGVEIYYRAPSFLLSAGGSFLNSGYGHDAIDIFVDAWAQTSRAQAVTLIPTRADLWFADLIRFDPFPDPPDKPDADNPIRGHAVNMGVNGGLACGANLRVPQLWLDKTGATWDGPWLFLDLDKGLPDLGPLGFYVAIYSTPMAPDTDVDPAPDNLAVLYAMEADRSEFGGPAMSFADFERLTRERNSFPAQFGFGAIHAFHTPDNRTFTFWLQPLGEKYRPRIIDQDHPVDDFGSLNLVDGPYLTAPHGHDHDGYLEIRYPGCGTPLVLDYSTDPAHPVRTDNAKACPQPLIDRARAIMAYALDLISKARVPHDPAKPIDPLDALRSAVDAFRGFDPPATVQAEYLLARGQAVQALVSFLLEIGRTDEALGLVREFERAETRIDVTPRLEIHGSTPF